uniref:N-6 DNA methylase n=1 Tax=Alloprevotella sp. TaxID=1872471 RepID=UPI003FF08AE7
MITKENLKKVLSVLGFEKDTIGEYYSKIYSTCSVHVDFDNETLKYPEDKGLVVNDKTTSNFSHNENFVVFECVCRLLNKGYRPEHIELEPKWQLGRDAKSGKADIVVKDENGNALIIIECKTAGAEYNKEFKNTEEYGGQLFSYWQQENATRWLALYTSDWKDGDIVVKSQVINCTDDANIVKMADKDKDILIYRNVHNDKERFKVWDETYNKAWLDNIIFDDDSQAYNIGISPLRKNKLRDFIPEDKIVNRFEEILRHNNVSDKENAFNRLVALFICKLVDEIKKQDFEEVEFQYKQGTDTYEYLQDRLQRLHTQGMEEFMKEKIFYVEADYAERLFLQYTGKKRKQAIEDLNNTIRILKFYSNNDFAFKDVHNEELFFQNGKILVEVVQLFQPYRIVYPSKHQFLGDLFEQLLNKGFKQNEGQFFTPTPITRFIWDCLPLQTYISNHGLPNVIDYACGAGHFLTEAVEAINSVRKNNENSWVEKHIYGIEKDYRLARVSKISMFMNGAGGANIIFGDGLENYKDKSIENSAFDILVANPPYSVSGFKSHLKLRNNKFRLLNVITNDGKEIETLFVERIAQLLRPQGLAAVILPASILSNPSSSYIAAREDLLKNFYIRAIVSFGSKTFGATGTNTVTLFLERYKEPPCIAKLIEDSVNAIMSDEDISEFKDKQILADYLQMQNISEDIYLRFIRRILNFAELSSNQYIKVYVDAFNGMAISLPKKCSEEEAKRIRLEKFYDFALDLEKDKLYYFALVREQRTLVITAPSDNKEQKLFLGYDWSNRKGAEGIIINTPGGKLYNQEDRFARGTLACAVRNSFAEADTFLSDDLMKYSKSYSLKNMFDFSRNVFDKAIRTQSESFIKIQSKFPLFVLEDLLVKVQGKTTKISQENINEEGDVPVITQEVGKTISGYTHSEDVITDIPLIVFGDHSCTFKYVDFPFVRGADGTQLIKCNTQKIELKFLYYYLSNTKVTNEDKYERHFKYLKKQQIPIPPIGVQKKIIAECETIDAEYNTSRMTIETYRQKISDIFDKLEVIAKNKTGGVKMLKQICSYSNERISMSDMSVADYISTDNLLQNCEGVRPYDGEPNINSAVKYDKGDILLSNIRPYLKKIWLADKDGGCSPDVLVIRLDSRDYLPEYVYHVMARQRFFDFVMTDVKGMKMPRGNKDNIMRYEIPSISLVDQQQIVDKIYEYKRQIDLAQEVMRGCTSRKRSVIEHYLN